LGFGFSHMVRLELTTRISAPIGRCFDLARSIDAHLASTLQTGERAIAGVTSGLIGKDEEVTWRARFFGFPVTHTSRVTGFSSPTYFQDSMVCGAFRRYCHDHFFEAQGRETIMKDLVEFSAPYGWLGWVVERTVVKRRLRKLLERRNEFLRQTAENAAWTEFLRP
jgi:ligand-binding SRPBCC domain-containing protein